MSNISDLLFENKECSRIFLSASDIGEKLETPVYLVGGSVRDLLMNKGSYKDIDLMVEKDSKKFSNELAKVLNVKTVIPFDKFHTYKIPCTDMEIEVAAARRATMQFLVIALLDSFPVFTVHLGVQHEANVAGGRVVTSGVMRRHVGYSRITHLIYLYLEVPVY